MKYKFENNQIDIPNSEGGLTTRFRFFTVFEEIGNPKEIEETYPILNMFLGNAYPTTKKDFEKSYEWAAKKGFSEKFEEGKGMYEESRIETGYQDMIFWHWYKDKLHIWDTRDEEGNLDFDQPETSEKGMWIDNNDLFKIAKRYYALKSTYKEGKGYTGVTDEIFDTEKEPLVDYKGEPVKEYGNYSAEDFGFY